MSIVIQVLSIRGLHFSESNQKVTTFEGFTLPRSRYSTFPNLGLSITMATPINITMVICLVVTKIAIQAINYRGRTQPCDVGFTSDCYSTFPNLGLSITMVTPINIAMVIRLVVTNLLYKPLITEDIPSHVM